MACQTCVYYVEGRFSSSDEPYGSCHRFPPVSVVTEYTTSCEFPDVKPTDWCGEYSADPDAIAPGPTPPPSREA